MNKKLQESRIANLVERPWIEEIADANTLRLLEALMAEVALIQDPTYYKIAFMALVGLPIANLVKKASKNHHPPDERGYGGNLLHTLRTVKVSRALLASYEVSQLEVDLIQTCALVHDFCRYGVDGSADYTLANHGPLVRVYLRSLGLIGPKVEEICKIVDTHMGRWSPTPYIPKLNKQDFLHTVDMVVSQDTIIVEV
jgi:hypothetical protein